MTNDSGRDPLGQALAVPVEHVARLDPSGFDPSRVAAQLGKAQRAVILSLDQEFWGPASSHACAKRMFWGVRGGWHLVDHKHRTNNCWSLTARGAAVQDALYAIATEARRAETSSGSVHEGAGLQGIAQPQSVSGLSHTGGDRG